VKNKPSLAPELYLKAGSDKDIKLMNIMAEQDKCPVPIDHSLPTFSIVVGPSPFTMPRGWEFFLCSPYEGVTYIATVLNNAGFPVNIIDVRYSENPMEEAVSEILKNTDVLGIATFEDNFPFIRELISQVKSKKPSIPIISGGSLVTSVPHIFMKYTETDIAVISEGELTILELMESFKNNNWKNDLKDIHGICYRDENGNSVRTAPRGQMLNLDFLPKMRLDLWPQSKSEMGLQPQIIASYSRGCAMDCSFCYRTTPQVAMKSPKKLDEDLKWLKEEYNIEFIFFSDLTFNAIKRNTMEILDVIKSHDIRWTCLTRCANVDLEQMVSMKEAGCDIALFGVESLGAGALKEARKPTTKNVSIKAMRTSFESGVRFGALTIVGLPGETKDSLFEMAKWAEEFNHITRVKYLSLMPGTTFYQQAINDKTLKSEIDHINWLSIEQALHEDEFINISGLDEAVVREGYKRIYDSYQPGPVMDFKHYPKYFNYFYPNPFDGTDRSTSYAGNNWRAENSSAGPHMVKGSENYILKNTGFPHIAEIGSSLMSCGAKNLN